MAYLPAAPHAPPVSDRLDLLWLRAALAACAEGPIPSAFGTTLHGALGRALKHAACAFPNPATQPCAGCRLLDQCPYPRLFEPQHHPHTGSVPPPALLVAPAAATPHLVLPGAPLVIDFALTGRGVHALPLLLVVLGRMAEAGFGPRRVPCTVVRVDGLDVRGRPAFPLQIGSRLSGQSSQPIAAAAWQSRAAALPATARLRLWIQARLRLQREGAVESRPPTFPELVRALVRRTDALARAHGGETDPFPDPRPWLAAAEQVGLADSRLSWHGHRRRSASTGHAMPLDGCIGMLEYAGPPDDLAGFLPLLLLGEAIGVGRGCSFGNGRYHLEIVPEAC